MQRRYLQDCGGEAIVVVALIESALVRNEEISNNRRTGQLRQWPSRCFTNKEAIVGEKTEEPLDIRSFGFFVQSSCRRDTYIDVLRVQSRHDLMPGLLVHVAERSL